MARRPGRAGKTAEGGLPDREKLIDFIRSATEPVGKREIAREFGVKAEQSKELRTLIADLKTEGVIGGHRNALVVAGAMPQVTEIDVIARDRDGDLIGEPVIWKREDGPKPRLLVIAPSGRRQRERDVVGVGDRVLARISDLKPGSSGGALSRKATVMRKLPRAERSALGIFHAHGRGGGEVKPIDRKSLQSQVVEPEGTGGAKDGDLVRYKLERVGRHHVPRAVIKETLGNPSDSRQISLIAVHAHSIPDEFPAAVLEAAANLKPATFAGRTDLTELPLLTIDPVDARDHDDAVHAAPDPDPSNPDGHVIHVAVADVAYYVRPASALDREAKIRGNSVYFPDRVVPMLPERLSNDLASLMEGVDRPCLVARIRIDAHGNKLSHQFLRAMMRSKAKLSYQEAQAAIDGQPNDRTRPLHEPVLKPLWAAYGSLAKARDRRGPLELDIRERRIILDAEGKVARVIRPDRLEAHRLIEEFMILANVAAAETLEAKRLATVYRVHAEPGAEKLKGLADFLETFDLKVGEKGALKPAHFNEVLAKAKDLPTPELISEVVLRTQSQAEYTVPNSGHFGLNLKRYAHFTSPIRRYADLIVHRGLIRALKLGDDGLTDQEIEDLERVAKQISDCERRAMAAERETTDRLIAAHLADRVGAEFKGRISGVTRSGLFVKLDDTGADGYVPAGSIGGDYWAHVEERHALVGRRSGAAYTLGDTVEVRLVEAIPSAGALRFELISEPSRGAPSRKLPRELPQRGFRSRRRR